MMNVKRRTNKDRMIDAAMLFIEHNEMDPPELAAYVSQQTGVPESILLEELSWPKDRGAGEQTAAMRAFLAEDDNE